jgi:hypothetical protein
MLRRTFAFAALTLAAGCTQAQGHDTGTTSSDGEGLSTPANLAGRQSFLGDLVSDGVGWVVHEGDTIANNVANGADRLLGLGGHLSAGERDLTAQANQALLGVKESVDALSGNPLAGFPDAPQFFDDLVQAMIPVVQKPGLVDDLLAAAVDPRTDAFTQAAPDLLLYKDRITYNRSDLNGAPYNLSAGGNAPLRLLVDRSQPAEGWNRSVFQRFLQLVHDGHGVAACNKEGAILHAELSLDGGMTYNPIDYPLDGSGAHECELFKIDDVSTFYLRSIVGEARLHLRNDFLTSVTSPEVLERSSGIKGLWPSDLGQDTRPTPQFLNRLVFFDVAHDGVNPASKNYTTNHLISDLMGPHMGSAACAERTIDDPLPSEPDTASDHQIHGLRTCDDGQWLDQRDGDTAFALEQIGAFDSLQPLVSAFVAHGAEDELLGLLEVLYQYGENGGSAAEPLAATLLSANFVPTLRALSLAAQAAVLEGATGFGNIFR